MPLVASQDEDDSDGPRALSPGQTWGRLTLVGRLGLRRRGRRGQYGPWRPRVWQPVEMLDRWARSWLLPPTSGRDRSCRAGSGRLQPEVARHPGRSVAGGPGGNPLRVVPPNDVPTSASRDPLRLCWFGSLPDRSLGQRGFRSDPGVGNVGGDQSAALPGPVGSPGSGLHGVPGRGWP